MLKAGVDIKGIEFAGQYHGFIPGTVVKQKFEEEIACFWDLKAFIDELVELADKK